jgi:hypothetical protein
MKYFLIPITAFSIIFILCACGPNKIPSNTISKDQKDTVSSPKPLQTESKSTATVPIPVRHFFETSLGNLKPQMLLLVGANFSINKKGQFQIVNGLIFLKEDEAIALSEELKIYSAHKLTISPDRKLYITLIQDIPTGKWLATKGLLLLAEEKYQITEGHIIRIIGGNDKPIKILNNSFSDTTICIKNGNPVIFSEQFETPYQKDAVILKGTSLTGKVVE